MKQKHMLIAVVIVLMSIISCGGSRRPDPGAFARIYGSRAAAKLADGNLLGAVTTYQKAAEAAARADLPLLEARYRYNTGRVWHELGMSDSAEQVLRESYRDFIYYRDSSDAALAAGMISLINAEQARYDSAFAWYGRGRPATLKGRGETAFWLMVQAKYCIASDRIPEAEAYLDKAMECFTKDKDRRNMARVDYCRAQIARNAAQHADARAHLQRALASLDKAHERYGRWRVLIALSAVSFCLRDEESGIRFYRRAVNCVPRGIAVPAIDALRSCPNKFQDQK
ncbi:MAG: hypothetical protein MUF22_08860 [Chitinispirillaceae bacterium]|jgi:tetratricopeptide (TPR) repeat protein|nr:hypothetical protein [Chitinispirillaceae bacterium]